jgi:hypothetical protein
VPPEPLLLLEGGFVPLILQPGSGRAQRGVQPGPRRQCLDNQNEIALRTFRVCIAAGEGKGQSCFPAQFLDLKSRASGPQYGSKPI